MDLASLSFFGWVYRLVKRYLPAKWPGIAPCHVLGCQALPCNSGLSLNVTSNFIYCKMTPCSEVFHTLKPQKGFIPKGSKWIKDIPWSNLHELSVSSSCDLLITRNGGHKKHPFSGSRRGTTQKGHEWKNLAVGNFHNQHSRPRLGSKRGDASEHEASRRVWGWELFFLFQSWRNWKGKTVQHRQRSSKSQNPSGFCSTLISSLKFNLLRQESLFFQVIY